jgi:hypothetical protein
MSQRFVFGLPLSMNEFQKTTLPDGLRVLTLRREGATSPASASGSTLVRFMKLSGSAAWRICWNMWFLKAQKNAA